MNHTTSEENRKHFCTYQQAFAAIPEPLPFKSNGHVHVAVNLSTGHRISCADAYMAAGYVAGSAALLGSWKFALDMGHERVASFPAHPNFSQRMGSQGWEQMEQHQHPLNGTAVCAARQQRAQAAFDRVMNEDDHMDEEGSW